MSDELGVVIKAYNEFTSVFEKYQQELRKTQQAEKETNTTTAQFDRTLNELVVAERTVESQTEKVNKALNATGVSGKQAQAGMHQLDNQMKHTEGSTDSMRRSADDLLAILGQVGVLYAFRQGLHEILSIGVELESQLTKVAAITKEPVAPYSQFIQGNKGSIFNPAEQAKAMIELGASGLQSAETLKALPDVLNLATAGMVNLEQAATPVLNVIKTFQSPVEETGQIVDAFVEAANRSALQVEDLSLSMSMSSAAAKLAGMDYRELISVLMILRDAGLQASDAGTSVKSAILAMMNPSKEAIDMMDQLGINIYTTEGNMKSWAGIISEFEKGLTGLSEKERNLVLSTIAGSDGIRALSLSMARGSSFIRTTTEELQKATGAAQEVAAVMGETTDASLRRITNNLKLTANTIFQDAEPAFAALLGTTNGVIEAMSKMDEGTRKTIELLIGTVGLAAALLMIISIAKKLITTIQLIQVATGWGAIIAAISAVTMGIIAYAGHVEEAKRKQQELNTEMEQLNKITQTGLEKSQIESSKARVKALDEEIAKLKEQKKELEANIELWDKAYGASVGGAGAIPGATSAYLADQSKLKEVQNAIDDRTKRQKMLNDAIEKATLLDGEAAQTMATKAIQTKVETMATTKLIDEYLKLSRSQNLTTSQQERLKQVAGELGDKYLWLVTAIDDQGKATKLNTTELENERNVLNALAQAEIDSAKSTMQANLTKTQVVLDEAKKRIEILLKEQEMLRDISSTPKISGAELAIAEVFNVPKVANKVVDTEKTGVIDEIRQQQKTLNEASRAVGIYKAGLESLNNIKVSKSTKTLDLDGDKNKPTWLEGFRTSLQLLQDKLTPYEQSVSRAGEAIDLFNAKQQFLNDMLTSGKGGLETVIMLEKVREQTISGLTNRQQALINENTVYQQQLSKLSDKQREVNGLYNKGKITQDDFAQATSSIRQEQERLTQAINRNAMGWWNDEKAILAVATASRDEAFKSSTSLMQHEVAMKRLSVEQQIKLIRDLRSSQSWSTEQMWQLDERLTGLYTDQIKKDFGRVKDEYDKILAAMDAEEQKINRGQAKADHNKKIQDLQEQRRYHELRTGKEHAKALADIDKQIAEENQEWQQEQDKWSRDDKRKALEEQYKEVQRISETGILESIAAMAATDPKWLDTGKSLINSLIDGLKSGDFSHVYAQLDSVRSSIESVGVTSLTANTDNALKDLAIQVDNQILQLKQQASTSKGSTSGLAYQADQLRQSLRDAGVPESWILGNVSLADATMFMQKLPTLDTGAWEIAQRGLAVLDPAETVLPSYAAAAFRDFATSVPRLDQAIEIAADKIVAAIREKGGVNIEKIVGAENYYAEDEADIQIFARELGRSVRQIVGG
ncbi:MAG: phage tail tape measure protein [Bacillota bacterium]